MLVENNIKIALSLFLVVLFSGLADAKEANQDNNQSQCGNSQVLIEEVQILPDGQGGCNSAALHIIGKNFDAKRLAVRFGQNQELLTLCDNTGSLSKYSHIFAKLPPTLDILSPGQYLLTVANGNGGECKQDEFDLAIIAQSSAGPQGEKGDPGMDGAKGEPGAQGPPGLNAGAFFGITNSITPAANCSVSGSEKTCQAICPAGQILTSCIWPINFVCNLGTAQILEQKIVNSSCSLKAQCTSQVGNSAPVDFSVSPSCLLPQD